MAGRRVTPSCSSCLPPPAPTPGVLPELSRRQAGAFLLCRLHIYAFSMNNFYAKSEQVAQFTLVKREREREMEEERRSRSRSGQLLLYKSGLLRPLAWGGVIVVAGLI